MSERPPRCPGCFTSRIPDTADSCPACGFQPEQAARERSSIALPLGTMIRDRYRIGRVLGKPGGFGVTYLAFDERLHIRVALKEYMPRNIAARATRGESEVQSAGGAEDAFRHGLDQFLSEARILAQFDHPNVVGVNDYFEARGTAYLVMDYYEGTTVDQHLAAQPDGRMDPERASGIIEDVAHGLREVHAEGYLHRDIKPSNIYLAQDGRPILIDFGAARAAFGERSQNLSVLVSPGYAPHEQYRQRGDQGPHTDVYSCGASLYRMVTGVVPDAATERIVDDKLKPPHTLNPSVPPPLSTVILEAMTVQAEDRIPTAEVFQQRLRTVPQGSRRRAETTGKTSSGHQSPGQGPSRGSPPPKPAAAPSSGTPQWPVILLGVLIVALLGLGGYAASFYDVGLFAGGSGPPVAASGPAEGGMAGSTAPSQSAPSQSGDESSQGGARPGPSSNPAEGTSGEGEAAGTSGRAASADGSEQEEVQSFGDPAAEDKPAAEENPAAGEPRQASGDGGPPPAPTVADDAVTIREDSVAEGNVLGNDSPGGEALSVTGALGERSYDAGSEVKLASGARLTLEEDGSYTYAPSEALDTLAAGETATDRFRYTARTDDGREGWARVTVTIRGTDKEANQPPLASAEDRTTADFEAEATGGRDTSSATESDSAGDCRIVFTRSGIAFTGFVPPSDSTDLEGSPLAQALNATDLESGGDLSVSARYAEGKRIMPGDKLPVEGRGYFLTSDRAGPKQEMEAYKTQVTESVDEALQEKLEENDTYVHCFAYGEK